MVQLDEEGQELIAGHESLLHCHSFGGQKVA